MNFTDQLAQLQESTLALLQHSSRNTVGSDGMISLGALTILGGIAIALVSSVRGSRERRRRLEVIEAALRNPSLTPEVQRELAQMLRPAPRGRTIFAFGWIGVALGIGWLLTNPIGEDYNSAVFLTAASFGVVTLPLALRELEARRA
jgi:hypothetical protein